MTTPPSLCRINATTGDLRTMHKRPASLRGAVTDPTLNGAFLCNLQQATEPLGIWKGLNHLTEQETAAHHHRLSQNWRRTQAPVLRTRHENADSLTNKMHQATLALLNLRMHEHVMAAAALSQTRGARTTNVPHQQMQLPPQQYALGLPVAPEGCIWAIVPCVVALPQPGFPRVGGFVWAPVGVEHFG